MFEQRDSEYINLLRGGSVLRVVLAHLGLSWFLPPYSWYISIFLPVLFFVSGAVSFQNYIRKPFGVYLFKRVTGLWIPFFLLTVPAALIFSVRQLNADPASLVSWLLLWPPQSLFPFKLTQIWFINVLLLMVICSVVIFPILRRSSTVLFAVGLFGYFLLTLIFDRAAVVSLFRALPLLGELRLTGQLHQTFVLAQFYFLGAFYYKTPRWTSRPLLIGLCLITLLPGLYLSFQTSSYEELENRNACYILLAHAAIFTLLLGRDALMSFINRIRPLEVLLLFANRNSYGLFLLHSIVLVVIEHSLNMEDLSGNILMALVRLLLVLVITMLLSIPFTILSRSITTRVTKMLPGA